MYKKTMFLVTVALPMIISFTAYAVPSKCSPCHAKRAAREALKKSKDVDKGQADVNVCTPCGKTRRDELVADVEDPSKCGSCKTTEDEVAVDLDDPSKCGCKTTRDELSEEVTPNPETEMIEACCVVCEEPDSLGCQGENKDRCRTCIRGRKKLSLVAAAAAALAAIDKIAYAAQLDAIPEDGLRAPREPLSPLCTTCDMPIDCISNCQLNEVKEELHAIKHCCHKVNQNVECQWFDSRKCCKKIKHELHEIEELVESVIDETEACCSVTEGLITSVIDQTAACCSVTEGLLVSIIDQNAVCCSVTEGLILSVIDQSVGCCSVIETVIGDPALGSVLDIPTCIFQESIVDLVNGLDVDIITWLKSLYVLLYGLNSCLCC